LTLVAACICTYRREQQLTTLLDSLAAQEFPQHPATRLHVIVVDNDSDATAENCCRRFAAQGRLAQLTYRHEPRRGISFARNTGLDLVPADADFVAITDDDAVADPRWIDTLLTAQAATDADIVLGPSIATFAADMPAWLGASGCFDKPPEYREFENLGEAQTGATCNLFMRGSMARQPDVRFHPELSLSGSEDNLFLRELKLAGYRLVWSTEALIYEPVTPARATLDYLCRESYRRGLTSIWIKQYLRRKQGKSFALRRPLRDLGKGIAVAWSGGISAVLNRGKPDRERRLAQAMCEFYRGVGIVAGVFGIRSRHYL